jgi:transposase
MIGPHGQTEVARGRRCAECRRYLFAFHHPRPAEGRRWEHRTCEGLEPPDPTEFAELAEALLARRATPETRQLREELTLLRQEFSETRAHQTLGGHRGGGPEDGTHGDLAELAARCTAIHEELLEQLRRKARELQDEWMTGTDADGRTVAGK